MFLVERTEKWLRLLIVGLPLFLIFVPEFTYMENYEETARTVFYIISLIATSFIYLWAFMAINTKGYVTDEHIKMVNIPEKEIRRCGGCKKPKPERSHHCSICNKCILKFDHHCNFLSVCVNYFNQGYFVKFLLSFMSVTICAIVSSYGIIFYKAFVDNSVGSTSIVFASVVAVIASFLTFVLFVHLCVQIENIVYNRTTVEKLDLEHYFPNEEGCVVNPYDFGFKYNTEDVFGPLYYGGLYIPSGSGVIFDKKYEADRKSVV